MTKPDAKTPQDESKLMTALAVAMLEQPRATLQELASAVGISRTTLYRFCRTREQLVERLVSYGGKTLIETVRTAGLETLPPLEALSRLTANSLEHREITSFLTHYEKQTSIEDDTEWNERLDGFFLRGQQEGLFRIDISAAALTEIWVSVLIGLIDAERRGRIPRQGMAALVERAFLTGAVPPP